MALQNPRREAMSSFQRVTTDPANDGNPSWSHDSQWIYFDSARTGQQQLWKVPANGGQAIQLTQQGGFAPIESPDGKSLYYVKSLDASSLWRFSLETGEVSEVLENLSEYQNFAIAPGGIYFVPLQTSTEDQSIKFLNFATKHITTIAWLEKAQAWGLAASTVWGLALSPDGKWLLYGREQQAGSELMLVEIFTDPPEPFEGALSHREKGGRHTFFPIARLTRPAVRPALPPSQWWGNLGAFTTITWSWRLPHALCSANASAAAGEKHA